MIKPKTCVECGAVYTPRSWNPTMVPICSEPCKELRRERRRKRVTMPCLECGVNVTLSGENGLNQARKGRAYCSDACKRLVTSRAASEALSRTNRLHAAARMKTNNPMHRGDVRERMVKTLREIGHGPKFQGGNGRPAPEPQRRLAEALGWPMELVVKTGMKRGEGPGHYKLDIASLEHRVAIEVDGGSHCSLARQEQDERKQAFLEERGWRVLRFKNREVMADLEACVRTVTSTTSKSSDTTTTSRLAS